MLVAALAAYIATAVIHLPGPYSAVITTLIVARPHSGGVLRASFERLSATVLGAAVACLATFGRLVHVPELLLFGLALSPLALVAAHNSAYRTSMIAAVIVLSAPAAGGTPLHVAGARMLGVSLGAVIGALVSLTILPSRREVVVARAVAGLLEEFPQLLRNAIEANLQPPEDLRSAGDSNTRKLAQDRLEFRVRQALRELGLLVRDRPDALPTKGAAGAMAKFTLQMHADLVFLKRELAGCAPPLPGVASTALGSFAQAYEDAATNLSQLARGRIASVNIEELRSTCGEAARALRETCPQSEGARLMLRRLIEDFTALCRSVERAVDPRRDEFS
jgi:uncharacterized membrane protein YccC